MGVRTRKSFKGVVVGVEYLMGTFRTVSADLNCLRCAATYACAIQFKTGHDEAMPDYAVGDIAEDVEPGFYDGIGDAYCPTCSRYWIEDEKRAHFHSRMPTQRIRRYVALDFPQTFRGGV